MGLAARKNKQRIGADPRNLAWSEDASKFGAKYLQNLGWTSGSGLGASGEGRISNLKIHQKLDLMGIGANARGVDDANWKVGRQFDRLLARLNKVPKEDPPFVGSNEQQRDSAHVHALESKTKEDVVHDTGAEARLSSGGKDKQANERRRRKRSVEEDDQDAKDAKRRRKEKKAKREAKMIRVSNPEVEHMDQGMDQEPSASPVTVQLVKVAPRFRAHRARHLKSKRLAISSSTKSLNEILGIAPDVLPEHTQGPSSIPFPARIIPPPNDDAPEARPLGRLKNFTKLPEDGDGDRNQISVMGLGSLSSAGDTGVGNGAIAGDTKPPDVDGDGVLRKSSKSVAEYFAEKMRMKSVAQAAEPVTNKGESKSERREKRK